MTAPAERSQTLLWDAIDALHHVAEFVAGQDLETYRASRLLRRAVERELEIVGEALGQLRRADPDMAANVPVLAMVVGLRNVLAHGYGTVNDGDVWTAATRHAPALLIQLETILATARREAGSA